MAYNLLAIAQSELDWATVNERFRNTDQMFEVFPIADPENGDSLGISIPTNYFNEQSWHNVCKFLSDIAGSCPLDVYDMYAGHSIDVATYVPDGLNAG